MGKTTSHKHKKGWHPADIKAGLAKKGYTFASIARKHGYVSNSPNTVLWRPWSTMERIVAGIIGVKPQTIWPSRYNRKGQHLGTKKTVTNPPPVRNV